MLNTNEQRVFDEIKQRPFMSQQELATQLGLTRSTIATIISSLVNKGYVLGRAYVINEVPSIYCIGAMNIDRKYVLQSTWMNGTSNPVTSSISVGGVARNIAENLGRLGHEVSLLSVAGEDHDYQWLKQQTAPHVNMQYVTQFSQYATSAYTAVLDSTGEMQVALADMAICEQMTPEWIARHYPLLLQSKWIVVDLNAPQETVQSVIQFANQANKPLMIVPVSAPKMKNLPQQLQGVTWLIVNQDETETYFNVKLDEMPMESVLKLWLATGVENILVTQGSKACYYANQQGEYMRYSPPQVLQVVDVTGAGDSLVAGILHGLLQEHCAHDSILQGLCNAYYTVQSNNTVRHALNAQHFETEYQLLQSKGEFIYETIIIN